MDNRYDRANKKRTTIRQSLEPIKALGGIDIPDDLDIKNLLGEINQKILGTLKGRATVMDEGGRIGVEYNERIYHSDLNKAYDLQYHVADALSKALSTIINEEISR